MPYFDLFVAAVPSADKQAYTEFCTKSHAYFLSIGATGAVDCWGDDVPGGELTSLPMAVKCGPDETVAAGWIVWPDKATRDAGWKQMMENDPEMQMPFDGKRMIFGGFSEIATSAS
ncbi:DUF1428 domain-containing protein [Palleronia pelagia]|uniref:Uncharacterized conserved protein YbaA, DUF1428 family n=1 Tax=Palleronia pelagia TaxID=387096 RepID=A0A1H8HZD2_9RHOB|nr:DUF1428 domain-containing protein [Palleronia pelagia]SEN61447.1 Uncharacterized conserved protein YbaA, DUF1428 family [Palleronia pelagia]